MIPRVLAGALAAASLTLGGCAWLIGEGAVPQPEPPLRVAVSAQPLTGGALSGAMTYLGVGDRIETAKNLVGRVGRALGSRARHANGSWNRGLADGGHERAGPRSQHQQWFDPD